MAQNKKNEFADEDVGLADFANALSHPARIAILKTIAGQDRCICGEIVDVMPLAQSTVSQHIKELKKAGLIRGEIEGPKSCYCIDWDRLGEMREKFESLFGGLDRSSGRCCKHRKK
ncbi:MAG TPA: metalloregulator ArsR/SmtB family transcription factor [Spirochaetota bacterium]|nr:metalloregulator ArsR/SmtB family transcription factor [Spirochaetota bacterium]HSA14385.1 metalloregulator ArsR/SmtB family transcription factor [Spirochaetota bacterium]